MKEAILLVVAAVCNLIDAKSTAEVIRWADTTMELARALWLADGLTPEEFDSAVDQARTAREATARAQFEAEERVLHGAG